jgi:hypothetical protein
MRAEPIIRQNEIRQGEPQEPTEIQDSVGHRAGKRRCVPRPGGDHGTLARLCAADGREFILTRQEKAQLWLIISTSVTQQKFSPQAVRIGALNKGLHYRRKGPRKGAPALPGQGDESAEPPTGFTVSCQVQTSAASIAALANHYKASFRECVRVKQEKTQLWIQKLTSQCGEVQKMNEALNESVNSAERIVFLIKEQSQAMAERETSRDYSLWTPAVPTGDGYRPQTIHERLARYRSHPPELLCINISLRQRSCQFASTQLMDRRGNSPQISIDECIEIITDVDFPLSECKIIIELEAKLTELTRQHHVLHDFLIAAHSAVALSLSEQDHMAELIEMRIFASMSSANPNVGAEPPVFLATNLGSSPLPDPP